ncbi:phosphatase PAP2 family protein [Flavobacterium sp. RSP46]|nr:phosphatase PAP2 family protein [Flavobacterium sp. LB2P53]RTY89591.1 phosphatase PAP2 family protein [Flavobacterium sp. RSP46]
MIMNLKVINNYAKLKITLFFLPLILLLVILIFLSSQDSLTTFKYVQIQKDYFLYINHYLGQYPNLEYNLTQLGDASVFLSFIIIFIVYAPKIWEAILTASLASLLFSYLLKNLFLVPRPAQIFDNHSFIIVGKTAIGFSSLPSGHSITVFTILTVLLFAFIPKKLNYKILWVFSVVFTGLIIVFSRVGVGAHHPLDVIIGSIIGYISGLIGIFASRKYKIWNWVNNKKYYPIFILLIVICGISFIIKINRENFIIFDLALISLIVSLYKIIHVYVKK